MAFIACVFGSGKSALCVKSILFMDIITTTLLFTQTKYVAINDQLCFPRWWISGCQSHTVM